MALHRSQLASVCSAWNQLTKPDSSAWETVDVTLRSILQASERSAVVDRTPFLDWLARRVGMLRRVQILARYHLEGVRCLSTNTHSGPSALWISIFHHICRTDLEICGNSVTT